MLLLLLEVGITVCVGLQVGTDGRAVSSVVDGLEVDNTVGTVVDSPTLGA
jgi:hypothetical protein